MKECWGLIFHLQLKVKVDYQINTFTKFGNHFGVLFLLVVLMGYVNLFSIISTHLMTFPVRRKSRGQRPWQVFDTACF